MFIVIGSGRNRKRLFIAHGSVIAAIEKSHPEKYIFIRDYVRKLIGV